MVNGALTPLWALRHLDGAEVGDALAGKTLLGRLVRLVPVPASTANRGMPVVGASVGLSDLAGAQGLTLAKWKSHRRLESRNR